jgi:hypothetical protein
MARARARARANVSSALQSIGGIKAQLTEPLFSSAPPAPCRRSCPPAQPLLPPGTARLPRAEPAPP